MYGTCLPVQMSTTFGQICSTNCLSILQTTSSTVITTTPNWIPAFQWCSAQLRSGDETFKKGWILPFLKSDHCWPQYIADFTLTLEESSSWRTASIANPRLCVWGRTKIRWSSITLHIILFLLYAETSFTTPWHWRRMTRTTNWFGEWLLKR